MRGPTDDAGLLLYGALAIATFLGLTERQVRHRVTDGELPTFKPFPPHVRPPHVGGALALGQFEGLGESAGQDQRADLLS